jgi:Coenzyme PQQ synthesis protein D (PqqD)
VQDVRLDAQYMLTSLSLLSFVQWSGKPIAAPVDEEIVILSVERGSYYGLDDIGSDIWQRLETRVRVDALCNALIEKYEGDRATIERDVLQLLGDLAADGLISVAK